MGTDSSTFVHKLQLGESYVKAVQQQTHELHGCWHLKSSAEAGQQVWHCYILVQKSYCVTQPLQFPLLQLLLLLLLFLLLMLFMLGMWANHAPPVLLPLLCMWSSFALLFYCTHTHILNCCSPLLLPLLLKRHNVQIKDLQASIVAVPCDAVLVGTPHDISRLIEVPQPLALVTYRVTDMGQQQLEGLGLKGSTDTGLSKALAARLAELFNSKLA
jgi:hypothetical protein